MSIEIVLLVGVLPLWLLCVNQSYLIGRLEQRSSEQTEQILDLVNRLKILDTKVQTTHDNKLIDTERRVDSIEDRIFDIDRRVDGLSGD